MRVEGQLILNSLPQRIDAAEAGLGLAYVPDDCVAEALASGRRGAGAGGGTPPSPDHLMHPSRRQHTSAFTLLLETLRR